MRSNETDLLWCDEVPAKLVLLLYVFEKMLKKIVLNGYKTVEKKSMYLLFLKG